MRTMQNAPVSGQAQDGVDMKSKIQGFKKTLVTLHDPDKHPGDFHVVPRVPCGSLVLAGESLREVYVAAAFVNSDAGDTFNKKLAWAIPLSRMEKAKTLSELDKCDFPRRDYKALILNFEAMGEGQIVSAIDDYLYDVLREGRKHYQSSISKVLGLAEARMKTDETTGKMIREHRCDPDSAAYWLAEGGFMGKSILEALEWDVNRRSDYLSSRIRAAIKFHSQKFKTTQVSV